ncbi:hypothetical protein FB451DRAFT_1057105, partial [Mycena latifolia]
MNGRGGATVPQKRKLGAAGGGRGPEKDKRRRGEGDRAGGDAARAGGEGEGGEGQGEGKEEAQDEIRCLCRVSMDDGFSIACDMCGRWAHAACVGVKRDAVPEEWACWVCAPQNYHAVNELGNGSSSTNASKTAARRRGSVSGRRAGTLEAASASPPPHEADLEDERSQYVLIDEDVIPHASTQHKLRAYAAQWRGVSALSPPSPLHHTPFVFPATPTPHPTALRPVSVPAPCAAVLPPAYGLHAAAPAPPRALLSRFPALITPSAAYLRAPANGYAHAGAPKRFVHLVGPPLDLALDARGVGGRARWVRSGCWPNAELRAYVCGGGAGEGERREKREKREGLDEGGRREGKVGEPRTHFGIFATRALRAGEEIVVGWEWDDGNAVH